MIEAQNKRFWQNKKGSIVIALGVWFFVITVQWLGWFQWLEWAALDRLFQTRPLELPDERIVIIGVTEADIRRYQQYPFSDNLLAQLLEKTKKQSPRVIGLDLFRNIPVGSGRERLEAILKSTPNLIGIGSAEGYKDDTYFTNIGFPPILYELSKKNNFQLNKIQVSDVGLFVDDDGVVRRGIIFPSKDPESLGFNIPSFGAAVAFRYLKIEASISENRDWMRLGKTVFHSFRSNDGGYVRATESGFQTMINWRGPAESFLHVSVQDVIEGKIDSTLLRDRIVLIGATAPTLSLDAHNTPFSKGQGETPKPTYGVEIQANIASQILSAVLDNRPLIQVWSQSKEAFWILAWTLPIAVVGWVYKRSPIFRRSGIILGSTVILTVILIGTVYIAFQKSYWIPVVPVLLSLWGTMLGIVGYTYIERIKEANASLRKANTSLEEANAMLETKVAARTLELSQKNQELAETLQKLHQAQEQIIAKYKLTVLGGLVAGTAHEFNNYLNLFHKNQNGSEKVTKQFKNLLENCELSREKKIEQISKIVESYEFYGESLRDSIQFVKHCLNKFLPYKINKTNHSNLEKVPIEINQFIQECFAFVGSTKREMLLAQKFQLKEDYDPSVKILLGDPRSFSLVLINLMNNAWDALVIKQKQFPENYLPSIVLKTRRLPDKIQIIVQDNGIGVTLDQETDIFEPYFSTKPQGEGIGLGLSVARDIIVAESQGNIYYQSVETEQGKETQFIVEIPLNLS